MHSQRKKCTPREKSARPEKKVHAQRKKCTPREKILATRMRKGPPPYVGMGLPRMVNPALRVGVTRAATDGCHPILSSKNLTTFLVIASSTPIFPCRLSSVRSKFSNKKRLILVGCLSVGPSVCIAVTFLTDALKRFKIWKYFSYRRLERCFEFFDAKFNNHEFRGSPQTSALKTGTPCTLVVKNVPIICPVSETVKDRLLLFNRPARVAYAALLAFGFTVWQHHQQQH